MKHSQTKRILKLLFGLWLALALVGCPQKGPQGQRGAEGNSSGGGGFVSPNSKKLLEITSRELGQMLSLASPEILSQLPKGWDPIKIAELVENVRKEENKVPPQREGQDLMFDYGVDSQGPYISAVKAYFFNYSWVAVEYLSAATLWAVKQDLYRQLIHEVAHHMGVGVNPGTDGESDDLARRIVAALTTDMMLCKSSDEKGSFGWFVFRALGVGYSELQSILVDPRAPWETQVPYVYYEAAGLRVPRDAIAKWKTQVDGDKIVLTDDKGALRLTVAGPKATGAFEKPGHPATPVNCDRNFSPVKFTK